MEGVNIRELAKKRGTGYRCLVEAVIDHEICPDDPLTDIVRKGAQGVAYDFWYWGGNWREVAIAIQWEKGHGCNYIETYRRKDEVKEPITEIKFVREFMPNEKVPENNPLFEGNAGPLIRI